MTLQGQMSNVTPQRTLTRELQRLEFVMPLDNISAPCVAYGKSAERLASVEAGRPVTISYDSVVTLEGSSAQAILVNSAEAVERRNGLRLA